MHELILFVTAISVTIFHKGKLMISAFLTITVCFTQCGRWTIGTYSMLKYISGSSLGNTTAHCH